MLQFIRRATATLTRPSAGKYRLFMDEAGDLQLMDSAGVTTAVAGEGGPGGSTDWADITGKPATFAPSAHGHAIADVTGLQTELDGKQDAGSYAAASHSHAISDVTGLQTELDGKQPLATVLTNTTAAFTSAQETKLAGIASGATANSSDTTLLDRANHTGTQPASTISDFTEASQDVVGAMIAAAGGSYDDEGGTITLPSGSDPWTWASLASNNTVSTTAYADVTGMSFIAASNTKYLIRVFGAYQTATTTTGIALTLDIPGGSIIGQNIVSTSATVLGGTEIITDNASTGASTGVRAANTNTPIQAWFVVSVGVTGGTVQLRQRSEVAGSNSVLQAGLTIMGYRTI